MKQEQVNQVLLHEDNLVGADLEAWIARGGGEGLARASASPADILSILEDADLRGMGGAGFPTHRKWGAVASQEVADKWLICNGNEDEPGTFKDRLLLERAPHQVLEGALIAAVATGANHIAMYINPHEESTLR